MQVPRRGQWDTQVASVHQEGRHMKENKSSAVTHYFFLSKDEGRGSLNTVLDTPSIRPEFRSQNPH